MEPDRKMDDGCRPIPFTQFLRPNGRRSQIYIRRPREVADKADAVIRLGGRFTAEELMTGLVSLACEYDDRDVALEVCENGPKVMETADKVVINAYRYAVEGKRQDYCEEDKP